LREAHSTWSTVLSISRERLFPKAGSLCFPHAAAFYILPPGGKTTAEGITLSPCDSHISGQLLPADVVTKKATVPSMLRLQNNDTLRFLDLQNVEKLKVITVPHSSINYFT